VYNEEAPYGCFDDIDLFASRLSDVLSESKTPKGRTGVFVNGN